MKVLNNHVLGTKYEVICGSKDEIGMSSEHMGECRIYSKCILIDTGVNDCTENEREVRVQETVAHEFFHAYLNEAGIDLGEEAEERVCDFFSKNWRKLNNSILEVLDETGFLDI